MTTTIFTPENIFIAIVIIAFIFIVTKAYKAAKETDLKEDEKRFRELNPHLQQEQHKPLKLKAQWTDDCQGKKDYDAELISLSSRYWPRRGGYYATKEWYIPLELPSAVSSIIIRRDNSNPDEDDDIILIEKDFEAETEAEVKAQVEQWAQQQFQIITDTLREKFQ